LAAMAKVTMLNSKIKRLLDYIPLVILITMAINLIWSLATTTVLHTWMNIVGLIFLPINICLFIWHHKYAVLALGFTLLLGLIGIVSFDPGISSVTLGWNNYSIKFYADPIYLLWLTTHFIISGRYYFGIASKKYWAIYFKQETL